MTVCVSVINMKGGVGKTTLATQLAWHATLTLDKRVLLIDLDPQANASQSLMTPQNYVKHLTNNKPTIVELFEEFTPTGHTRGGPTPVDPQALICEVAGYEDGSRLDVLPSRLELSWTLRNPAGKETLLARFVSKIEQEYDLIVIDCAPADSMLTDAAYMCSRHVLVPMKAEFLATIGFPMLKRSLEAFKLRHAGKVIEICGLVLNDYNEKKREYRLALQDVAQASKEYGWPRFENNIRHSDSYFRAARDGKSIAVVKGAHQTTKSVFFDFATEFFERIKL